MKIGNFGKIKFVVSAEKINSFRDFNYKLSSRWAKHSAYKGRPTSEFLGPDSSNITFSIYLDIYLGVSPRREMKKWENLLRKGKHDYLIIGGEQIGKGQWKVESVGETWERFYKDGKLIGASIDITFSEY